MMNTLVISGGGLQGLSFIGCLQYLEEQGMLSHVRNFVGTSIGSLLCLMLALDLDTFQIRKMLREGLLQMSDKPTKDSCVKKKLAECVATGGLESDARLMKLIEDVLALRFDGSNMRSITFRDFVVATGRNVVVTGSNITDASVDLFCIDRTPDMSVAIALRISMALPLVFSPVWYEGKMYTDGAVFQNFPISFAHSFPRIWGGTATVEGNKSDEHVLQDMIGIVLNTPHTTVSSQDSYNVVSVMQDLCQSMYRRLNPEPKSATNELRISVTFEGMDALGGYDLATLDFCCVDQIMFNAMVQMGYACAESALQKSVD